MKSGGSAHQHDGELAAAYVCGELTGEEKQRFEERLHRDRALQRQVEALQSVLERLAAVPPAESSCDLAPRVLKRVAQKAACARRRIVARCAYVAAAAAAVAVGVTVLLHRSERDLLRTVPSERAAGQARSALDWLAEHQGADGSWDPGRFEGQQALRVGFTALGALAFLRQPARTAQWEQALDRAVDFLLSCQGPEGCIRAGPRPLLSQHALATLALSEAFRAGKKGACAAAVRAVSYIEGRQLPCGGWGQRREEAEGPDIELSLWQLAALCCARRSGLGVSQGVLARGLRFLLVEGQLRARAGTRSRPEPSLVVFLLVTGPYLQAERVLSRPQWLSLVTQPSGPSHRSALLLGALLRGTAGGSGFVFPAREALRRGSEEPGVAASELPECFMRLGGQLSRSIGTALLAGGAGKRPA